VAVFNNADAEVERRLVAFLVGDPDFFGVVVDVTDGRSIVVVVISVVVSVVVGGVVVVIVGSGDGVRLCVSFDDAAFVVVGAAVLTPSAALIPSPLACNCPCREFRFVCFIFVSTDEEEALFVDIAFVVRSSA
jgi:hypothetical protein